MHLLKRPPLPHKQLQRQLQLLLPQQHRSRKLQVQPKKLQVLRQRRQKNNLPNRLLLHRFKKPQAQLKKLQPLQQNLPHRRFRHPLRPLLLHLQNPLPREWHLLPKQPNLQPLKQLLLNRPSQNPCQQQNLHPTLHLLPKPLLSRLSHQHQ